MEGKVQELYRKSENYELCVEVMQFTENLLRQEHIQTTDAQKLSLLSHLSAMVYRSTHKERIEPIDKHLFQEVSKQSIEMAEKVCNRLTDLHEDEKYLLSIHFETAKMKD